jgi:hypothetical protein
LPYNNPGFLKALSRLQETLNDVRKELDDFFKRLNEKRDAYQDALKYSPGELNEIYVKMIIDTLNGLERLAHIVQLLEKYKD